MPLSDNADTTIDRIGAYLSVGSVGPVANWDPLPFTPQVESPGGIFLDDKDDWRAECQAMGGIPLGAGTDCDTNPCGVVPATRRSWGTLKTIYR